MNKRIEYLDGIKVIMCFLVMLAHYYMAYLPNGYIGYGSAYAESEKAAVFIGALPVSLFVNTSLELYVFFGLISMITAIAFYRAGNQLKFLEKQFMKRYFRFVIPVAAAILLTYGLNEMGVLQFDAVYHISDSTWNLAIKPADVSVWKALYIAFLESFFVQSTGILSTLWCLSIIFIGSFLTYGFLAIMGNSKKRYMVYIAGALLFIPCPQYAVFLAGIVCGDFFVHHLEHIKMNGIKRELTALAIFLSGIAIGIIPSIFVSPPFTLEYTYATGTLLLLFGIMMSDKAQRLLSCKILVKQAKYSFSFLLVQFLVLYGVSSWIFKLSYALTTHYTASFWVTFMGCAVISHFAGIGFYHLFEKPSAKLADMIYDRAG